MLRKTLIVSAILVAAYLPAVGASHTVTCTPGADGTALAASGYYVRVDTLTKTVELWLETNTIHGLQTNTWMACGSSADLLVFGTCLEVDCQSLSPDHLQDEEVSLPTGRTL